MATTARRPVTALVAVVVLVALALHFGITPPPAPTPPAPAREEADTPEVTAASIGKPVTISGRVGQVAHGEAPFLVLAPGRREAVCRFRTPESDVLIVADVRTGDSVAVRGVVESVESGSISLAGCKFVPPRSREAPP